jgi:hypothetical protein
MPTNVLLAPVGSGKTDLALTRLARTLSDRPFARVWALLATNRQEDAFRQRLAGSGTAGAPFISASSSSTSTNCTAACWTLRASPRAAWTTRCASGCCERFWGSCSARSSSVYGRIAHTPGFVRVAADFISNSSRTASHPTIWRAAQSAKDRELASVYSGYQDYLRSHRLVDKEGEAGWP